MCISTCLCAYLFSSLSIYFSLFSLSLSLSLSLSSVSLYLSLSLSLSLSVCLSLSLSCNSLLWSSTLVGQGNSANSAKRPALPQVCDSSRPSASVSGVWVFKANSWLHTRVIPIDPSSAEIRTQPVLHLLSTRLS